MSTILVDSISDTAGTGSPSFPNGVAGDGSALTSLTSSNLTGALPAIDGSALTSLTSSNLTGSLPAIDGSALTSLTSSNLTGSLPAIDGSALTGISSAPSTADVLTATAGLTAGAVGTYVFARGALSTSGRQFVWNSTYSGSGLYPAGPSAYHGLTDSGSSWNSSGYGMAAGYYLAPSLSGTWRCLGYTHQSYDNPVTLFVRIS
jgi:hypothetical protein